MGSKEWPPCIPSQENKSTEERQRKVAKYTKPNQAKQNQTEPESKKTRSVGLHEHNNNDEQKINDRKDAR